MKISANEGTHVKLATSLWLTLEVKTVEVDKDKKLFIQTWELVFCWDAEKCSPLVVVLFVTQQKAYKYLS